jgi:vacuolar-type H+-ATPase subunit E/Vma4
VAILGDPEALAAEMIRRAQHRAVEIAEKARLQAASIVDGAKQEAEALRRQSEQEIEQKIEALVRQGTAHAELEAQRRFVLLREAAIEGVWRAAEERLRQLVKVPGYQAVLKRFARRAARELGTNELTVAADPVGHELLSAEVLKQWSEETGTLFHRSPEPISAWGGLLATSGRVRFDLTFQTQLNLAQETLRARVFEILSR